MALTDNGPLEKSAKLYHLNNIKTKKGELHYCEVVPWHCDIFNLCKHEQNRTKKRKNKLAIRHILTN